MPIFEDDFDTLAEIERIKKESQAKRDRLDKNPRTCSTVEECFAIDHEARKRKREEEVLEQAFDPDFEETPFE